MVEPTTTIDEPILEIGEIQGNILVGFNKPYQAFLFLRITDVAVFRGWLAQVVEHVATTAEVLAFNRLWKTMRWRRGGAQPALQVAWFNLGFSASGLKKLGIPVEQFADKAFREGLGRRSSLLGDPLSGPGSPDEWRVGGPGRESDLLLIFAADTLKGLNAERQRIAGGWEELNDILHGAELLHTDHGQTLPEAREPFGFVDGISQPGVRGRISNDPTDFLTPRRNPHDRHQGMPGQDLIWPGEFVFGYWSQRSTGSTAVRGPVSQAASSVSGLNHWAKNGSFLVIRRLDQDVEAMDGFVRAASLEHDLNPHLLAAKLIGRWRSGAPLRLAPSSDDPNLSSDGCRVNAFGFREQIGAAAPETALAGYCSTGMTSLASDSDGLECPLGAHIRKMNPRDDLSRFEPPASPSDTRTRRILRRGIPYDAPTGSRMGLLFLAYQTSLIEQFEFIQRRWANVAEPGDFSSNVPYQAGLDPIIGRDPARPDARRPFRLRLPENPNGLELSLPAWVTPAGGGYFFCPSVRALAELASLEPALAQHRRAAPV